MFKEGEWKMSNEQSIRLKLKTAYVEIEYEGSEDFLRSDLLRFVAEVAEIHKANPPMGALPQPTSAPESSGIPTVSLSVNSIAAKLEGKTGRDLILASCAYLTLAANRETFGRKDILESMKTAATFYKKSYESNLSSYLARLVKDNKILQQDTDVYALPVHVRNDMESKLGN
jgi:hypothetical protein